MSGLLTPRVLSLLIATLGSALVVVGVVIALYRPRTAVASCCALLLLAGTKFRGRDAQALIGGDVDRQVIYELVLFCAVALVALRAGLRLRRSEVRPVGMEVLLTGYVGLALLSVLWATNLNITAVRSGQLAILLLFSLIAVRLLGPKALLRTLMATVVCYVLVLAALVPLFPGFAAGRHFWVHPRRFSWFGVHPLMVAMYAGSALILLLAFTLFASPDRRRNLYRQAATWLAIAALGIIVVLTRSRAALLATTAAVQVLLLRKFIVGRGATRSTLSMMLVLLWSGLVAALVMQQLMRDNPMTSRLGTLFMRGQTMEALRGLNGRDLIWAEVVRLFADQPVLGYGYLASRVLLLEKIPWAGDGHFALAESLMNVGGLGTALVFLPLVHLLATGTYFLFRGPDSALRYRAAVTAATVFTLINSMSTPGFAGPPTFEVLLFFVLVLVNGHLNLAARQERVAGWRAVASLGRFQVTAPRLATEH